MTEKEALKLALEALKYPLNQSHENFNVDMAELLAHRAITAIKEALAQPEQEPWVCECGADSYLACKCAIKFPPQRKKPEQERFLVATIGNWGRVEWADGVFPSIGDKMYSAPPKWVGLTGHEQKALMAMSARDAVFATEAKLKEKNT